MASEEQIKLKRKYLKRAQNLISVKSDNPPKRKLQVSVEPYCIHHQDGCHGSIKGGTPPEGSPSRAICNHLTRNKSCDESSCNEMHHQPLSSEGNGYVVPYCIDRSPNQANFIQGGEQVTAGSTNIWKWNNVTESTTPLVAHRSYPPSSTPASSFYAHDDGSTKCERISDPVTPNDVDLCTELKSRLKVQMNVNKELKRLLIASVGSDLQHRLEQIVHEKAELSHERDTSFQQLIDCGEEMDRVSIECDIWRSKFLASRLMIDELATWKAELSLQYRESQLALQHLIQEREQLTRTLFLAVTHLSKVVEQHSVIFSDAKIKHPTKPLTVLDVGQTLNLMSQTLCSQATEGTEGAGFFQVQVCEPTVGETLAKQALSSQQEKSQERSLSLPIPLHLNQDVVHERSSQKSPLLHNPLKHSVMFPDDLMNIPFCCSKCKGKVFVI